MTQAGPVCARCGIAAGSASTFKRSVCEACVTEAKTRRQTRSAVVHVVLLVAGIYVFLTRKEGVLAYLLFVFAFTDVVGFVTTAVHEAAHALTGLVMGFRIREISLGIGPRLGQMSIGETRLILRLYPLSGHTAYIPRGRATRMRAIGLIAAGPLSHLPLALLANGVIPNHSGWQTYRSMAVTFILVLAVLNLIPFRGSDGWSIVKILTMPDAAVAGLLKAGAAMDVVIELQAAEEGRAPISPLHRDAFLDHLEDPTVSGRDRAISLNNLAVADLLLNDPDLLEEADRVSREAMELLPDLAAIRNTRGAVLIAQGDDEEGISLMEPTVGAIPAAQRGSSHAALALAYARTGRLFDARRHIAAARALGQGSAQLEQAETLAGPLEAEVARRYMDGRSPKEAAVLVRTDAGALASTMAAIILRHIEASGEDGDLRPMAEALLVR